MGGKQSRLISEPTAEGSCTEQAIGPQECETLKEAVNSTLQSTADVGEASAVFCSGIEETARPGPPVNEGVTISEGAAGQDDIVPTESEILAGLVSLLGQVPSHSMALADLCKFLPPALRSMAEDTGNICRWLRGFGGLLEVTGEPGAEVVRLTVGKLPRLGSSDAPVGAALGKSAGDRDTGSAAVPAGAAKVERSAEVHDNRLSSHDADCLGATVAADEEGWSPSMVQLRGLPFRATMADIIAFLGTHAANLTHTEQAVRLLLNRDGRPSGFARVQFASSDAARACREALHRKLMGDRYIEVLTCSDRAGRLRDRRVAYTGRAATNLGTEYAGSSGGNSESADVERVLQELRDHMQLPGRSRLLLSALGIALSAEARSYIHRANLGLKHFLARFSGEFRIEGPKGCEEVVWAGAGLAFPGYAESMAQVAMMNDAHAAQQPCTVVPKEPSTPKAVQSPTSNKAGLPRSAQCVATPSDWGTPGHMLQTTPDGITQTAAAAAAAAANTFEMGMFPGGGPWPPFGWPAAWPADGTWPAWPAAFPNGQSTTHSPLKPKKKSGRPDAPASRSHAHLHPQSHPFSHRAQGSANASSAANDMGSTNSGVVGASASSTEGEQQNSTNVAALRLRGLPFSMTVQDVLAFFAQHDVADRIVDGPQAAQLLPKANGRPSGQAVVQMRSRYDAEVAQQALCNQWINGRYIEVFVYGDENEAVSTESNLQVGNPPFRRCGIPAMPQNMAGVGPSLPEATGQTGVPGTVPWNMPPPWNGSVVPPIPGGSRPPDAGPLGKDGEDPWSALFNFVWQEQAVPGSASGVTSTVSATESQHGVVLPNPGAVSTSSEPLVPAAGTGAPNKPLVQADMPVRATLQV